jgi:acyl-CoA synthetase (NDP forming)
MTATRSVRTVLQPRSIAIVGASETAAAGWSKALFENIRHFGTGIPVYPINPRRDSVWGERCYHSFADLPHAVDLALMVLPAAAILDALRDGLACGLRGATIYAAGFGEGPDHEGADLADELRALCAGGLTVVGPNCMGSLSVREKLYLYPAPRVLDVLPGNIALAMQSGGLLQFWVQQASARGLGFSYAVTTGNELNLDLADYIDFFVDDESTQVICALAEGIRRPAAFIAAAEKALARRKPIVMLKIGRTEAAQRAAQSHTGSLAGDDRVLNAVCERYGILRVGTLDDMIETALVLRSGRLPRGTAVAMIGYSGAARGLALDIASDEQISFAELSPATVAVLTPHLDHGISIEMPVDLGPMATVDPERYSRIGQIVLADPNVALLAIQGQLPVANESANPEWLAAVTVSTEKPVFAYSRTAQNVFDNSRAFQSETGMSFVQGIPESLRAAKHLVAYAKRVERGLAPAMPDALPAPSPVEEALKRAGVQSPAEALSASIAAAVAMAERIGYPVALKLHSESPLHKTELGGVALGLCNEDDVRRAASDLFATIAAHPELHCDGVLVQEMVSGLEMIVGARTDPQFGPVILVGLGGVFVEAFDDIVLRLLPVSPGDVRDMLSHLRGKVLLGAFRGKPERDVGALVDAIVSIGDVFLERRAVLDDIEINPLIVLDRGSGVRAVDIRAIARSAPVVENASPSTPVRNEYSLTAKGVPLS